MKYIKNKHIKYITLSLFAMLFAISCNINTSTASNEQKNNDVEIEEKFITNAIETQDAFIKVHQTVQDSIVNISTSKTVENNYTSVFEYFFDMQNNNGSSNKAYSLGSGFVVSEDGYILTNNHVIDGADDIVVRFSSGKEYNATIVGKSPEVDIALLKINNENGDTFKPLTFADSDDIKVGQWSIAFGNPLGLNDSMTVGVISAVGRASLGIEEIENFIQTDASINQGNSGGPLIDINGKVIGMNTAILSTSGGNVGLGFAIPSNLVSTVMESLRENGSFSRPYIGVEISNITDELAKEYNLDTLNGVFIRNVVNNAPASSAGVKQNDIIIKVDNKNISNARALVAELAAKKIGSTVTLTVLRGGNEVEIPVKLEDGTNRLK